MHLTADRACRRVLSIVAIGFWMWPSGAGATDFGAVADGNWSAPVTWTDGANPGVPGGADRAFIGGAFVAGQAASAVVAVTTNQAISEIYVAFSGPGAGRLDMRPDGSLAVGSRLHVGMHPAGTGTLMQTGGVLNGAGDMTIGEGGPGSVALTGGVLERNGIYVALGAAGSFAAAGGDVTNTGGLVAGYSGGSGFTGTIRLSDQARVVVNGQTEVGSGAVGGMLVSNATLTTVGLYVANGNAGTLSLVDAVVTNAWTLNVGHVGGDGVTGRVAVTGGRLTSVAGQCGLGVAAAGVLTLSNAWATTGQLYMGFGAEAELIMIDSVLVNAWGGFRGGLGRSARVHQIGGTNLVNGGEFWMGEVLADTANTYTLEGAGAVLEALNGRQLIGVSGGRSIVHQLGGTVRMNDLQVGFTGSSDAVGIYNLSGGELHTVSLSRNTHPSTAFNFTGGMLSADTVGFTLANAGGTLAPGRTNSIGVTQLNGMYTVTEPGAVLALQLGGTVAGVGFDVLRCTGSAQLGGELRIHLVGEFQPDPTNTFEVVSAPAVSGAFANAPVSGERYNVGEANFMVTYSGTAVTLSDYRVLQPPSGLLLHVR